MRFHLLSGALGVALVLSACGEAASVGSGAPELAPAAGAATAEQGALMPGFALMGGDRTRPIADFVDRQGTFCLPDGAGGCVAFVPPVRNFVGTDNILDGLQAQDPADYRFASVDYAGLAEKWLQEASGGAATFGTTTSGTVVERPLPDGRAKVHVNLHTRNALTWVVAPVDDGDDNPYAPNPFPDGALLFGYRAPDLLNAAGDGLRSDRRPGLSDVRFSVEFINTAPGAPLPDLNQLLSSFAEPGSEFQAIWLEAHGDGPLRPAFGVPADRPAHVTLTQTAPIFAGVHNGFKGAFQDAFPVEHIELRPIGK